MVISAPWSDYYLNDCKVPPNFHHHTFPNKHLFYIDWKPVSEKKTLIKLYLKNNLSGYYCDKSVPLFMNFFFHC